MPRRTRLVCSDLQFVGSQLQGFVVWGDKRVMATSFRTLLLEHRAAAEHEVVLALRDLNVFYGSLPAEKLAESAARIIGLLFLAYDDPQSVALRQAAFGLMTQRHEQGVSLKDALTVVALPRRAMCKVLRENCPDEDLNEGIEQLTLVVEDLSAMLIDAYDRRMTTAIEERTAAERRFRLLYDRSPIMMHSIDTQGRLIEVNEEWEAVLGYERSEVIGRRSAEFMTEESGDRASNVNIPQMFRDGYIREVPYQFVKKSGELVDILLSAIVVRNADDSIDRTVSVLVDVTKRLKSENTVAAQEEIIRALSCPLIPFGRGALLMPLIGHINAGRATRIVEELARGVVTQQATIAILDVTGVPNVDAEVADALLRAASVVRLLGAEVMLTGIQPGIAKVIVELGIDMSGFTIKSSLREGLQLVMRNREWRLGNRVSR